MSPITGPPPLLPVPTHKPPGSLPRLWARLSLNGDDNVSSLPSSGSSSTSEPLSVNEFCWQGGWSVGCRTEEPWRSEPSVPNSIWKPTGRTPSVCCLGSQVRTGQGDLPFIGPTQGVAHSYWLEKLHLPATQGNPGSWERWNVAACASGGEPHSAKGDFCRVLSRRQKAGHQSQGAEGLEGWGTLPALLLVQPPPRTIQDRAGFVFLLPKSTGITRLIRKVSSVSMENTHCPCSSH